MADLIHANTAITAATSSFLSFLTPSKPSIDDCLQLTSTLTEDSPKHRSLEALGSSLCSERKLSAFSIYNGESEEEKINIVEEPVSFQVRGLEKQSEAQQSNQIEPKPSKDKREQYRLQTKNLNRFFRSKINEMLREIRDTSRCNQDVNKSKELLGKLNQSNKIMFSQIRQILKDEWLHSKLLSCRSLLLKYVHKGKMGMQSKLIMLKYFNKVLNAIQDPESFSCWK